MSKEKPNCYECKHRGTVPGDRHSCCRHPDLKEIGIQAVSDKFEIQANYHGIKKGWFNWPWNFDPVWLENCNGFETKED